MRGGAKINKSLIALLLTQTNIENKIESLC